MKIRKLISIKNTGVYKNISSPFNSWDGCFKDINLIYGDNGSGKTTLSIIFRSLINNNNLLKKKRRFNTELSPEINMLTDSNQLIKYENWVWNTNIPDFFIFDIHYIEENLFTGYESLSKNKEKLFEIVIGKEGVDLKKEIDENYIELEKQQNKVREMRATVKMIKGSKVKFESDDFNKIFDLELDLLKVIQFKRKELNIKLGQYSKKMLTDYVDSVNKNLSMISPSLKLSRLKNNRNRMIMITLLVENNKISFSEHSDYSVKYVLSEGDRNALAFSFFLAEIERNTQLCNSIVIFDDPISSFDYSRKSITVNILRRLSKQISQLFVFTHDLSFSLLIAQKIYSDNFIALKINRIGNESNFNKYDPRNESLIGIYKDLVIVNNFLKLGANTEIEKRDVVRCFRPILEGFFRIKYFDCIFENEWLGSFIDKIRNCDSASPFYRLKDNLASIEDINEYSKDFHHSDPTYFENSINSQELVVYANQLIRLIREI